MTLKVTGTKEENNNNPHTRLHVRLVILNSSLTPDNSMCKEPFNETFSENILLITIARFFFYADQRERAQGELLMEDDHLFT